MDNAVASDEPRFSIADIHKLETAAKHLHRSLAELIKPSRHSGDHIDSTRRLWSRNEILDIAAAAEILGRSVTSLLPGEISPPTSTSTYASSDSHNFDAPMVMDSHTSHSSPSAYGHGTLDHNVFSPKSQSPLSLYALENLGFTAHSSHDESVFQFLETQFGDLRDIGNQDNNPCLTIPINNELGGRPLHFSTPDNPSSDSPALGASDTLSFRYSGDSMCGLDPGTRIMQERLEHSHSVEVANPESALPEGLSIPGAFEGVCFDPSNRPTKPQLFDSSNYNPDATPGYLLPNHMTGNIIFTEIVPAQYSLENSDIVSSVQLSNIRADPGANSKRRSRSRSLFPRRLGNGLKKQRGPFGDGNKRRETSNTREASACLTCKVLKERCESNNSQCSGCQPCIKRRTSVFSKIPCFRYNISALVFYRESATLPMYKGFLFTGSKAGTLPIVLWDESHVQVVRLVQGINKTPLVLHMRRFSIPDAKFTQLEEPIKKLYQHQYGISDMDAGERAMEHYVASNKTAYICEMFHREDPLCQIVFQMACCSARESLPILQDALNLWSVARMIEGGWRFDDSETLGFVPNTYGIVEIIPEVTPLLSAQVGAVIIGRLLTKIRSSVLAKYEDLILKERTKHWLVLFLVTFVLLDNFERIVKFQRRVAEERGSMARFTNMSLIDGILQSSKALLTVFHLACKGQKPFDLEWELKGQYTRMDFCYDPGEQEVDFMRKLVPIVRERHSELISVSNTDHYEKSFWFTGQLFDSDWKHPDTRYHEHSLNGK